MIRENELNDIWANSTEYEADDIYYCAVEKNIDEIDAGDVDFTEADGTEDGSFFLTVAENTVYDIKKQKENNNGNAKKEKAD